MNFIFINPDEMRAESLGCYGHPLVKTPNFNKLAEEGVRFDQCHVTHTVCSPSRCSFLTGWHPHVHGHRSLWHLLKPDEPNLFKYLSNAGYDIIWYGKNDAFAPETFEGIVTQTIHDVITQDDNEKIRSGYRNAGNPFSEEDPMYYSFLYEEMNEYDETSDYVNVRKAIDYIKSNPENPFILYLPTLMPHCPYHAPRGYHDMYAPDEIPELRPVCDDGKPIFYDRIRKTRNLDKVSDRQLKDINAKYLGMISYVDSIYGELIEALEETGMIEDTAIFVFSDHGDWAGDYGLVEKWPSGLDDTLTRVPLIAKIPGGAEGHVVHNCVQHFDIMPTVLQLAGIKAEHTMSARSLVPQLFGEEGDPDRAVFAEGGYNPPQDNWCFEGRECVQISLLDKTHIYYPKVKLQQDEPESVCRSTMIRTNEYKLIYRTDDINELYDLRTDPLELNNVYKNSEYKEIQISLEKQMLEWYIETADAPEWHNHPRDFEK
ncbi:MAG: sulfatase-like hydrolase/transferase [Halanaerobiales bacterium]